MLTATAIEHYYTIGTNCLGIKDILLSRLSYYFPILMGDGIA